MTARAKSLHAIADEQLAELIGLISMADDEVWRAPCPGRMKLGDGTVAASAQHTAGNYGRIAAFVQEVSSGAHQADQHTDGSAPSAVVEELSGTRGTLGRIAELTDTQLDAIPSSGSFRFCDGQRTLEQVLAALLKHQAHQLDALRTAVAAARRP